MFIPLLSVIGVPPFSGFWPKVSLIIASLNEKNYVIMGAIIFGSLLTLIIIARLWSNVFWKKGEDLPKRDHFLYFQKMNRLKKFQFLAPIILLAGVSLYIGFGAEHMQQLSNRIASELIDNTQYIEAVMPQNN
tara:strand:- start:194 stop:592 length:399 start_codon:yes stop_codon:yes gene_type:complete